LTVKTMLAFWDSQKWKMWQTNWEGGSKIYIYLWPKFCPLLQS